MINLFMLCLWLLCVSIFQITGREKDKIYHIFLKHDFFILVIFMIDVES
ncbi:hypothetical protein GLYMA_11G027751v4 [Glycine max]|nr:hypothetical protein GLYMA_11G027751v4 [Glycine max]